MSQSTHDKLRYAQTLLSHRVPSGDLAQVLDRVLDLAIGQLDRQKFAATSRPHRPRSTKSRRHVPAHVKREVWERDGGQCTFVGSRGRRCTARTLLEFDHIEPVARGGQATVTGMRLRCRAHNQYAAEQAFGTEFMSHKRHEAGAARERQARAAAAAKRAKEQAEEVIPWLRALGFRADEAHRAAARCETIPGAPLEERVRVALSHFGPRAAAIGRAAPA
jgi:5-methylcytosine-specific restriction endonuclease McrA